MHVAGGDGDGLEVLVVEGAEVEALREDQVDVDLVVEGVGELHRERQVHADHVAVQALPRPRRVGCE